jgi:hypothetical protein
MAPHPKTIARITAVMVRGSFDNLELRAPICLRLSVPFDLDKSRSQRVGDRLIQRWPIILRALEDEANTLYQLEGDIGIVVSDLQLSLSRYWILSMYEALRIATLAQPDQSALADLYQRFRLVCMPIAKGQIAHSTAA